MNLWAADDAKGTVVTANQRLGRRGSIVGWIGDDGRGTFFASQTNYVGQNNRRAEEGVLQCGIT